MFDFFTSDHHFGHKKAAALRGFGEDVDAHDRLLIEKHNEWVADHDTTVFLGDFSFHNARRTKEIVSRLDGRKVLIPGNHDWGRSAAWYYRAGFDLVLSEQVQYDLGGFLFTEPNVPVLLSHLPYAGTPHARGQDDRHADRRPVRKRGQTLIHGHTHSTRRMQDNQVHVGLDAWDLEPVYRADVRALAIAAKAGLVAPDLG